MRNFIDILNENGKQPKRPVLHESILKEFVSGTYSLNYVVSALSDAFGGLERVGGPARVYTIDDSNQQGAIFVIPGTTAAIGFGWVSAASGISTIYVWPTKFSVNHQPSYAIDLPKGGDADIGKVCDKIVELIHTPVMGKIMVEGRKLVEARRTSADEFIQMARGKFGSKANKLNISDLSTIARENDVQIPQEIRIGKSYKVDAHHWNLAGTDTDTAATDAGLSKALGGEVSSVPDAETSPEYADAINLARAKTVTRMAGQGKVYLMGRGPKGAFFRIPGMEEYSAQLERMLSREISERNPNGSKTAMEEQYENLVDKVELVAGGKSTFIKSLLITGAPSSGKSYNVMQTISRLGLEEGADYMVKKGRITTLQMYRVLIENIDGLVIFDDCDSVVEDKNAVNMLKGALDTDPVREISYDVRGTVNTAVMSPQGREEYVNRLSKTMREGGIYDPETLAYFDQYARVKKKKVKGSDDDELDDEMPAIVDTDPDHAQDVFDYIVHHLPNKIDFKGRVIFISNMDEDEWDSAILSRAFTINMNFDSLEMLDYIDKVKGSIKTPNIPDEQKEEVLQYIRELYTLGKIKRSINFRLVQQAFDLRLVQNWRRLIAML